jgi:hypothetical protein
MMRIQKYWTVLTCDYGLGTISVTNLLSYTYSLLRDNTYLRGSRRIPKPNVERQLKSGFYQDAFEEKIVMVQHLFK